MTDEEKRELSRIKQREYQRRYREKNKAKILEKNRKYKKQNYERIREQQKIYRQEHRDDILIKNRIYNETHKEERKQYDLTHKDGAAVRHRKYYNKNKTIQSETRKQMRINGRLKTIKVVYYGDNNPDVIRLRKHLAETGETASAYIKRLIKEDLF